MAKPKEDDEVVKTTLRVPRSLLAAAKHRAIDDGEGLQDVIIHALEQYLSKKGGRQ